MKMLTLAGRTTKEILRDPLTLLFGLGFPLVLILLQILAGFAGSLGGKRTDPGQQALEQLLDKIGAPKTLSQLGTDDKLFPVIFRATGDIRDKYVLSRLAWDLGIMDELAESISV